MPIQPAAIELLTALAPIASRWGRWYVFGAQAVIVYGVPRLSADVDVTLALDVVLAGSGLEDDFLSRAVPTDIGGVTVPLIAPSDLIIAKILAGRTKDLDDARAIWRLAGGS